MVKEKKEQTISWALKREREDFECTSNNEMRFLKEHLATTTSYIFDLLEQKNQYKQIQLLDNPSINNDDIEEQIIEISQYIPTEMVTFTSQILPSNYYRLSTFKEFASEKNRIISAVARALILAKKEVTKDSDLEEYWKESILLIEVNKKGNLNDFDNYFIKPFVDGIKNSRFIEDDSSQNLSLIYSKMESKNQQVRFTLINKKYIKKYMDLIENSLIH